MLVSIVYTQISILFTSFPELETPIFFEFSENLDNSPLDTTGTLVDKCTLCVYTCCTLTKNKHIFVNMVKMWLVKKKARKKLKKQTL